MLWELRPAWPGTEPFHEGRYFASVPKQIREEEFLDLLACRKIAYIGDWSSPSGPARLFYIATADHDLAIAITTKLSEPKFYKMLPSPPDGKPIQRIKLKR